jgi:3-oxoacyl-[acyl-carrier protein] reductase
MDKPVAIVTGAGRGIGRAVAVQLSELQYRLALVSRTAKELHETHILCRSEAETIPADVSKPDQVEQLVQKTLGRFGRVDALIHCAGFVLKRSPDQMTDQEWHETIDINLSSAFYLSRALWPIWRKQGGGAMLNVSSFAGRDPFTGLSAYGAAKAGLNILSLALAREGKPFNIRIYNVAPAATETKMFRSLIPQGTLGDEHILDPSDVAKVIVQCIRGDLTITSGEVIYVHK